MTSSRLRLSAFVASLVAGTVTPPACAAPPVAATACANQRLPPEILDGPAARKAADPLPVVDVRAGRQVLRLAVAADEATRELGLMCVTRLRPSAGMIFVFDQDDEQDFWMKRTLVPLDMIWVAADGTVRGIAADVPASTLQTPDEKVARRYGRGRFVLELKGGQATVDGIVKGTRLLIPL